MSHQESPKHSVDVSDCYFYTNMLIIIKVTQKQQHIHKSHSFQYFRFTDISGSSLISYFILDLWPPEALRCGMQHYKWWWIKVGDGRWGDFMKNIIDGCGPLWGSQLSCSWKQFVSNKFEIALLQGKPELQRRQWHPTPVLLPGKSHGRRAWWAVVHGVAKSRTRLSDFTFTFHFHALEKEMATHSGVLTWRIPGTGEPGGLSSMGSHRVGRDWSDLAKK